MSLIRYVYNSRILSEIYSQSMNVMEWINAFKLLSANFYRIISLVFFYRHRAGWNMGKIDRIKIGNFVGQAHRTQSMDIAQSSYCCFPGSEYSWDDIRRPTLTQPQTVNTTQDRHFIQEQTLFGVLPPIILPDHCLPPSSLSSSQGSLKVDTHLNFYHL